MTQFNDLHFSIAYALALKARLPKATKTRRIELQDYEPVARVIVEHLQLCGYRIEKLPPRDHHSGVSALPKGD